MGESDINSIFLRLHNLTHEEGQSKFLATIFDKESQEPTNSATNFHRLESFLKNIIDEVDNLAAIIKKDNTILISVKNQKLLRTCFQLVSSLGISPCLIPGLGVSLSKRCTSAIILPPIILTHVQKHQILTMCTDFFKGSYEIPVLKKIIMTLHFSDYLAALIQLSFAPLKKPGIYHDFEMTGDMYDKLTRSKKKYLLIYEHLVANCFQPILMKELLILQSVTEPPPPAFVKRTIAKELSRRLLMSGGVLSLIRCFIETYDIDVGLEWKKIDMISKIVAVKHGNESLESYLNNVCSQLLQILSLNNTHYLTTAVSCVLSLYKNYPQSEPLKTIIKDIFQGLDYELLIFKSNLPGVVLLSPHDVENKVNILHACMCTTELDCPFDIKSNLYLLFLVGLTCTKNEDMKLKLRDITLKCLQQLKKNELLVTLTQLLYGKADMQPINIVPNEFEAGIALKAVSTQFEYPKQEALVYFLKLFQDSKDTKFVENVFEALLEILVDLHEERRPKADRKLLLHESDDFQVLDDVDEKYASILHLLSEISTSPKIVNALKSNPLLVLKFIEHFILNSQHVSNDECLTISLVFLNTILSNSIDIKTLTKNFHNLIPALQKKAADECDFNNILCKEALSLISSNEPLQEETAFKRAVTDVYSHLLPVRAHGIIALKNLIDAKEIETISKKHYIFCLFQDQLKDPDSYIYLAAINGLASLGSHCSEDVLQVLCKEFLEPDIQTKTYEDKREETKRLELRMKVGDIIVKVTKSLGEMAIVHKALLLNTMLCACRDEDPFIRTSALSNLAEIALVLHYKIGTIIYEVLLCIWSVLETDKAVECRRAAVMVISSLLKGLGRETLVQLKENLLPIYRTLKKLYNDPVEDSIVRLHAQIAIEELNDAVNQFLLPDLMMEKQIFVKNVSEDFYK